MARTSVEPQRSRLPPFLRLAQVYTVHLLKLFTSAQVHRFLGATPANACSR